MHYPFFLDSTEISSSLLLSEDCSFWISRVGIHSLKKIKCLKFPVLLVSYKERALVEDCDVHRCFSIKADFKVGLHKWGLLPETWVKHLYARSCISAVNTLTLVTLLKGSPEVIRGLFGFCMNDSAVIGKRPSAPSATTATGAHAAWGCPPSRSVCLSCWLGTAVWPFCLQERGEQPLSSNCCENSVGKPERSFHSRTHPGKNQPSLMKDHLG